MIESERSQRSVCSTQKITALGRQSISIAQQPRILRMKYVNTENLSERSTNWPTMRHGWSNIPNNASIQCLKINYSGQGPERRFAPCRSRCATGASRLRDAQPILAYPCGRDTPVAAAAAKQLAMLACDPNFDGGPPGHLLQKAPEIKAASRRPNFKKLLLRLLR